MLDPLAVSEIARAALALVPERIEERPLVEVVYSHSPVDPFGGVRRVADEAESTKAPPAGNACPRGPEIADRNGDVAISNRGRALVHHGLGPAGGIVGDDGMRRNRC